MRPAYRVTLSAAPPREANAKIEPHKTASFWLYVVISYCVRMDDGRLS